MIGRYESLGPSGRFGDNTVAFAQSHTNFWRMSYETCNRTRHCRVRPGGGAGRRTGSEGAGLGLSLVDEHVRMHGGRVWVEDRLDGESGARFVIELMATDLDD